MNFARVLVIAEAGVNPAAEAGADAVKFQTFRADEIASPQAAAAEYQIRSLRSPCLSQRDLLRTLELDRSAHFALANCAREKGILFLSSPFDGKSADLLEEVGVPLFKLGSGELTNIPLLRHVARKRKPVILSTGMATLEEVGQAVCVLRAEGNDDIVPMHCVTQYPAPAAEINLRAMQTMAAAFHLPVGYSDHTHWAPAASRSTSR